MQMRRLKGCFVIQMLFVGLKLLLSLEASLLYFVCTVMNWLSCSGYFCLQRAVLISHSSLKEKGSRHPFLYQLFLQQSSSQSGQVAPIQGRLAVLGSAFVSGTLFSLPWYSLSCLVCSGQTLTILVLGEKNAGTTLLRLSLCYKPPH